MPPFNLFPKRFGRAEVPRFGRGRYADAFPRAGAGFNAAPRFSSASVGADGYTWTINWTEPVTGTTGLVGTASETLTYVSGNGTATHVYEANVLVAAGANRGLTYVPGDFEDAAGKPMAAFTNATVTNGSALTAAVAAVSHYWRLSSGTDLTDRIGAATLTKSGTIGSGVGKVGATAAQWATVGATNRFSTPNLSTLGWTADRTWATWLNYATGADSFNTLFSKGATKPNLSIVLGGFNCFRVIADSSDTLNIPRPTYDTWEFWLITFTLSTATIRVYQNDTLVKTITSIPDLTDSGTQYIGGDAAGDANWYGMLEQMGFWPSVLDATDRAWLYNGGTGRVLK